MKTSTPNSIQKILLLFCLFVLGFTYGQVKKVTPKTLFGKTVKASSINPKNGIIRCATVEYEQFLQENNPKRLKEAQFEAWLSPLVAKHKAQRTSSKTAKSAVIITIPVVVHVIHNGEAIGTAPNITDAQVESQITVLNQDFRKMSGTPGFNSDPVGADIEIEFVLAKVDPNGNPTNGIEHINMGQLSWSTDDIDAIVKPATVWDSTQYMNMWSVKFSDNTLLGYAQFPDSSGLSGLGTLNGASTTDGVVSSFDVFGSSDFGGTFLLAAPYDKGRTMSHEVGHFLGLRHIWGDGNIEEVTTLPFCVATDYCEDTPTARWPNYDCDEVYDSCTAIAGIDMVENYMDYTTDQCMNIFTQNQKDRIVTVMTNSPRRNSLKTSTKGNPIPLFANDAEVKIEKDYTSATISDCPSLPTPTNKNVALTNRGTSALTAATINYSIAGGMNQTQTWTGSLAPNQTTIITLLNTASFGILNTSIGTTNGTTDQRVSNNTDTATFSPVNYTFTDYVFTLQQDFWGDEITWEIKDATGAIKYSGGPYTSDSSETLPLPAKITQNWTLANNQCYTFTIYDSQGDGLCCFGGDGFYNIKSTDGLVTIASGASYGSKENRHFTNNILGTNTIEALSDIYLYPNPTKGIVNISVPSDFGLPNSLTITNSLGQIVNRKEVSEVADLTVNTSSLSNGIYFITVAKEDQTKTLQFIKE
jgi:hypothetical protein